MKKQFIINLKGKDFVLLAGLLDEFFVNKGNEINTEELSTSTEDMPKFKATVKGEKGIFTGHGDANNSNVNSMIANHKYRMAETRAIARALRLYNNIGMCSVEELGGENNNEQAKQTQKKQTPKIDEKAKNEVLAKLDNCMDTKTLMQVWNSLEANFKRNKEIIAKAREIKSLIKENENNQ